MQSGNYPPTGNSSANLPPVIADSNKLKQVFLNLCRNAAEAMPDGGRLTVRANNHHKEIIVEVSDTGNGIPEGIDIWAPFVTTKSHGTGLGLMIVRQIVADHQGSVSYWSQPGKERPSGWCCRYAQLKRDWSS
jgi:signal transduction histidine kinase